MTNLPNDSEPRDLHELSWNHSQDGKTAVDTATGTILDVNPAMEALTGYSRAELIGMHVTRLHPEAERELVEVEFHKEMLRPAPHFDLCIQRKDGSVVPVAIWSSQQLRLDGRSLVIGEFRDIAVNKAQEHRLGAQNWALSAYASSALALASARSSEDLLKAVCEAIAHESTYVLAWVGIAEEGPEKRIRVAAQAGSAAGFLDGMHLSWSADEPESPSGVCIRTQKLLNIPDSETCAVVAPWRERARLYSIRSSVHIPLAVESGWLGELVIHAATPNAFGAPAIEVLQHLGEQIVHAVHALDQELAIRAGEVDLANLQNKLTQALSSMVAPLVAAMEMRDPYTAGHDDRVANIAVAIGTEMGWTPERLRGLQLAAQIHDVGKISIPAEILTKPTRLTAGEWAMICEHPETGYTILKDIPFAWPIAEIVRQHHERLDGSGYPRSLKGDEILPEAKVLAVADMVEAMASHRPYRAGIDLEVALKQIESEAGSKLDPEAVRVCAALFREKRLIMPAQSHH